MFCIYPFLCPTLQTLVITCAREPFIFLQAYGLGSTSGKIFSFCIDLQGELWCDRAEEPDWRWRQYSGAEGQQVRGVIWGDGLTCDEVKCIATENLSEVKRGRELEVTVNKFLDRLFNSYWMLVALKKSGFHHLFTSTWKMPDDLLDGHLPYKRSS